MIENYITLKSSRSYGVSTMFFPKYIRDKISILYSFLRIVDNFVDQYPRRIEELYKAKEFILNGIEHHIGDIENRVFNKFNALMRETGIEHEWIEAFFRSMEYDIYKAEYTYRELLDYMYGSAEIVGMCISRILRLDDSVLPGARLLGRGMQMINFVRDIYEDKKINRIYLPKEHREMFGVSELCMDSKLERLIRFEIELAWGWIENGKRYFSEIPVSYRIPIKTATELYQWIGMRIYQNPRSIMNNKIRPGYFTAIVYNIKNRIFQ